MLIIIDKEIPEGNIVEIMNYLEDNYYDAKNEADGIFTDFKEAIAFLESKIKK